MSECYILGGEDIYNVPWDGSPEAEIDALVSEELCMHTNVYIYIYMYLLYVWLAGSPLKRPFIRC